MFDKVDTTVSPDTQCDTTQEGSVIEGKRDAP